MPNSEEAKKELGSWVKLAGTILALAIGSTSLGFCTRGWVTPAEAKVEHEAILEEVDDRLEEIQQQTVDRFDVILERLPATP